jgi:hypothetical protein
MSADFRRLDPEFMCKEISINKGGFFSIKRVFMSRFTKKCVITTLTVIPANAGIQRFRKKRLDSGSSPE